MHAYEATSAGNNGLLLLSSPRPVLLPCITHLWSLLLRMLLLCVLRRWRRWLLWHHLWCGLSIFTYKLVNKAGI
jgi:hypothetical protein